MIVQIFFMTGIHTLNGRIYQSILVLAPFVNSFSLLKGKHAKESNFINIFKPTNSFSSVDYLFHFTIDYLKKFILILFKISNRVYKLMECMYILVFNKAAIIHY